MGMYNATLSLKHANQQQVAEAYEARFPNVRAFVSPQRYGWVTAIDDLCDRGDVSDVCSIAGTLAQHCQRACLAMVVVRSQWFVHWLFDAKGHRLEQSYPKDEEDATDAETFGYAGDLEAVAHIAEIGVDGVVNGEQLETILMDRTIPFDIRFHRFVRAIGIIHIGFRYSEILDQLHEPIQSFPADFDEFIHVGGPHPIPPLGD